MHHKYEARSSLVQGNGHGKQQQNAWGLEVGVTLVPDHGPTSHMSKSHTYQFGTSSHLFSSWFPLGQSWEKKARKIQIVIPCDPCLNSLWTCPLGVQILHVACLGERTVYLSLLRY